MTTRYYTAKDALVMMLFRMKDARLYFYALSLFIKREYLMEWVLEYYNALKPKIKENSPDIQKDLEKPYAHDGQRKSQLRVSDIYLLTWGNRGGKSVMGATQVSMEMEGIHPLQPCSLENLGMYFGDEVIEGLDNKGWLQVPKNQNRPEPPVLWWAASPIMPSEQDIADGKETPVLKKFHEWNIMPSKQRKDPLLERLGVRRFYRKDSVFEFKNKSVLQFKGYNQDTKRFASEAVNGILFDEKPPYDIWSESWTRLCDASGIAVFAMTPDRSDWTYYEFVVNPGEEYEGIDVFHMHYDMADNPHLGDKEKKRYLGGLRGSELARRQRGEYLEEETLAFRGFNRDRNVAEWDDFPEITDKDFTLYVIIDWHSAKPVYITYAAIDPRGVWYIFDESVVEDHRVSANAQEIESIINARRVRKYVIDKNASIKQVQETISKPKSIIDIFKTFGIRCEVGNSAFESAHSDIEDKFTAGDIIFHPKCHESIRQVATWGAERRKGGDHRGSLRDKFSDEDNDFCVNLIYLSNCRPKFMVKDKWPLTSYGENPLQKAS